MIVAKRYNRSRFIQGASHALEGGGLESSSPEELTLGQKRKRRGKRSRLRTPGLDLINSSSPLSSHLQGVRLRNLPFNLC